MQLKACVMATLAAAVSAQLPTGIDPAASSVLLQLVTVLPSDVLAVAVTNQAAFASEIASSIGAGKTPEWYQALPTGVKSVLASLYPVSTPAASTPSETAASSYVTEVTETSVTVITSTPSAPSATGASSIGSNSTAITSVNTPTLSGTPTGSTGSPSGSALPGAASVPSAAIGAGLAGVLGFLGLLAL
ncbi:hypothetical protein N0V90_006456 [Kalmusia sp. IMI 367209]|nr:hypothetical protein N0V90_006456 [Kalmusia sp. IMI 367209]